MICFLFADSSLRQIFIEQLRRLWELSAEQDLDKSGSLTFLGLELVRRDNGDLFIHQGAFIKQLLLSYNLDGGSKGLANVTVALPSEADTPPTPSELKVL